MTDAKVRLPSVGLSLGFPIVLSGLVGAALLIRVDVVGRLSDPLPLKLVARGLLAARQDENHEEQRADLQPHGGPPMKDAARSTRPRVKSCIFQLKRYGGPTTRAKHL